MAIRSARNVEKQKKKNRRAAPRKKLTRPQGNTLAVRRRLKKLAGRARAARSVVPCPALSGHVKTWRVSLVRGRGTSRLNGA